MTVCKQQLPFHTQQSHYCSIFTPHRLPCGNGRISNASALGDINANAKSTPRGLNELQTTAPPLPYL